MEKTITHHPLRTIELLYHRDRPQPEWEKETLAQYFRMHDKVWRLKSMREEYEPRLDVAIAHMEDIHRALPSFVQQMVLLEAVVGLREAAHVSRLPAQQPATINLNDFYQSWNKIGDDLNALLREITRCEEEFNRFLKEFEMFDDWFEAFAEGPLSEIYQRYEETSVDTVSLDRDHQRFLEAWQPIMWDERFYKDKAWSAFASYADLVEMNNFRAEDFSILDEALRVFIRQNEHGKPGTLNIRLDDDGEYRAF